MVSGKNLKEATIAKAENCEMRMEFRQSSVPT